MLLGLEAQPEETAPFTKGSPMFLRHLLQHMEVPRQLCYFNYVVKQAGLLPIERTRWLTHTRREIGLLQPRAAILLGLDAFNVFFNSRVTEIDQIRRTRVFDTALPNTTFFITHAPQDALPTDEGQQSHVNKQFVEDILAVFEVQPTYYMRTRTFGKTSQVVEQKNASCNTVRVHQ